MDWQRSGEARGGPPPLGAGPRQEEAVLCGSIDTSHNTADLGTKFHSGERLQELVRMMPIVVGEFEPMELPKKLLGALFLASQVTQVQGDNESTAVAQDEEVISTTACWCW